MNSLTFIFAHKNLNTSHIVTHIDKDIKDDIDT